MSPIELIEQLKLEKKISRPMFTQEYIDYVETLQKQVFEPNGYKLIAVKTDDLQ